MSDVLDIDHACLLYEDSNQQKAVALPFIRNGLMNGEHCIFLTGKASIYDWCLEFQAYGIDVKREIEDGALMVVSAEDWRQSGEFNSLTKARELWNTIEPKLLEFPAVRILGEAQWTTIEPALGSDQLCHWEATADLLYQGEAVRTICMYDLNRHSPSDIRAAIRTHPTVLHGGRQCSNPYYEASRILACEPLLNDSVADAAFVQEMLEQLQSLQVC
jgi:two-component system, chemotaxis family, sensor kinase Cph1